jgi:rRNA-processing protein EBP2
LEGLKKLHDLGVPTLRPEDYYAEMAKSDNHMKKIKEILLSKEAELDKRDKVRKLRELKKIGKQVQVENQKKKHLERKDFNKNIEDVKKGKSSVSSVLEKGGKKNNKRVMDGGSKKKIDAEYVLFNFFFVF